MVLDFRFWHFQGLQDPCDHQEQLISLEITSAVLQNLCHSHRFFFQLRKIAAHIWFKSWWCFHIDCFLIFKRFWKSSHLSQIFSMQLFFPMVFSLPAACHWWPWWPQVGTPNLQVLLLLPSFATLVTTMLGYPQKCPPYLTHICPISTFFFSYLYWIDSNIKLK